MICCNVDNRVMLQHRLSFSARMIHTVTLYLVPILGALSKQLVLVIAVLNIVKKNPWADVQLRALQWVVVN